MTDHTAAQTLIPHLLMAVLDALDDPVFVKDENHRWVLINQPCCDLIGLPREALLGKSDYDVSPPEEAEIFWKQDDIVLKTGRTTYNEEKHTSHDGIVSFLSTQKSLLIDPTTEKRYILAVLRNVTKLKEAEAALNKIYSELEQTVEERTADLRTANITLKRTHEYFLATLEQLTNATEHGATKPEMMRYLRQAQTQFDQLNPNSPL